MVKSKLMKTRWFPRPHTNHVSWSFSGYPNVAIDTTIVPIVFQDEGLGSPVNYVSNPRNSLFAETPVANCYPESRVERIYCTARISLTKAFLQTDKLDSIRIAFMPISLAFKDDYDAGDDVSTHTVKSILSMQYETTDRQGYPLFNTQTMLDKYTASADLPAIQPGLTPGPGLEAVTFDIDDYYDALQYFSIANKVKTIGLGLRWITLTRQNPTRLLKFSIPSKNKFNHAFNFFGIMFHVPKVDTHHQIPVQSDIAVANTKYITVDLLYRYNEWHQDFNHQRT